MTDQDSDREKGSSPQSEIVALSNSKDKDVLPANLFPLEGEQPYNNQSENRSKALAMYKNKMKDGKRVIVRMKRQKDAQLGTIISELLLLESHLRKEQSLIHNQLANRDVTITAQRQEIDRLRRDNRRLISRLKKITDGRDFREEKRDTMADNCELKDKKQGIKSSSNLKWSSDPQLFSSGSCFVKPSSVSSLTSQFYEKTALQFTDQNGQIVNRVLHKPPIAEKPKLGAARQSNHRPLTAVIRQINGQCNIVSTISRLLDEESDQGITGSSGSSEPSSPEATLKPTTPRVLKLARQYEKGFLTSVGSSSDSSRSADEHSVKALLMDEHEVTSGYNSDAISEQEHDYENVFLYKEKTGSDSCEEPRDHSERLEEEDDNYVILRSVRNNFEVPVVADCDEHTYSNIEYSNGEQIRPDESEFDAEERAKGICSQIQNLSQNELLETDLDFSNSSSEGNGLLESHRTGKNVPRSRHNINLLIDTGESHIMDNFEEFTLDSLDLEDLHNDQFKGKENLPILDLRHSGDGAEAKNTSSKDPSNCKGGQGGYEKFLEATGLSQKSILTPSRMFSNHRSVLKPRDIKHRDKLRAAFTSLSTLEEVASPCPSPSSTSQSQSSSQRYWREPYL